MCGRVVRSETQGEEGVQNPPKDARVGKEVGREIKQ